MVQSGCGWYLAKNYCGRIKFFVTGPCTRLNFRVLAMVSCTRDTGLAATHTKKNAYQMDAQL